MLFLSGPTLVRFFRRNLDLGGDSHRVASSQQLPLSNHGLALESIPLTFPTWVVAPLTLLGGVCYWVCLWSLLTRWIVYSHYFRDLARSPSLRQRFSGSAFNEM